MAELRIDFPRHGDVVSRRDGRETAKGLAITVRGQCPSSASVTVNGARALRDCGFKGLTGRFGFYSTGAPVSTRYHLGEEENAYLMNRNMFYEPELRFYIVNCP